MERLRIALAVAVAAFGLILVQAGPVGATTAKLSAWGNPSGGPLNVPPISSASAISAGSFHGLALVNGGVRAWGWNADGQATVPLAAQSGVTAIAAGGYHSVAVKSGGVLAWGLNMLGQTTVPPGAMSGVTKVAGGDSHSLALKSTGTVVAWGQIPGPAHRAQRGDRNRRRR